METPASVAGGFASAGDTPCGETVMETSTSSTVATLAKLFGQFAISSHSFHTVCQESQSSMDPISLILAALKAGAYFVGEKMAGEAVKDSYTRLKSLLISRVKDSDESSLLVEPKGVDVDVWQAKAKEILERIDAKADMDLVGAAQTLLTQVNQTQTLAGKFNVQANSINTVIQGDYSNIVLERKRKGDQSE